MPELPDTRHSLLLRLNEADDETAWPTFVQIYERAIYGFARKRGLQDSDARDVTQQVLIAVHNQITKWDSNPDKGSFRGWIFQVASNHTMKMLRSKRREKLEFTPEVTADLVNSDTDPSVFIVEYRRQVFLWAAGALQDRFQPSTWKAFVRTGVQGESGEKVARDLDMTIGAVYAAKCRVMAQLREMVDQLTGSELPTSEGLLDES